MTYVLERMRDLVLEGWEGGSLAAAFVAIAGLCALTISLALATLRTRTA